MKNHEKTTWQTALSEAVTSLSELRRLLELPDSNGVESDYPLFVPRGFVHRMTKGNPKDPLLLQVLPQPEEMQIAEGFSHDPVGEFASLTADCRVLKKYPGRALILTTQHCGVHCRFCFRRHLPKTSLSSIENTAALVEPIQQDASVEEVILSGGDPLVLDDDKLDDLLHCIEKIHHVKRIRIHSRLPVIVPSRITQRLAVVLTRRKPIFLVLHVNHSKEISEEFQENRKRLAWPILLSQTVLLKDVNDNVETLAQLFTALIDQRIVPYYLHQLDRVQGAAHYEVPEEKGRRLTAELRNRLPGYAMPSYVCEEAGMQSKQVVSERVKEW